MAEGTTIRADQIEGLADLVRETVREVLREEVKSAPEDMDQLRRSPAGTMIRLEEQVKALDMKIDQKFEVLDQKIEALKSEMDQRFEVVDQRFQSMDQRFQSLEDKMDQRFKDLKESMDQQFSTVKWILALIFPLLIAVIGKLLLMK